MRILLLIFVSFFAFTDDHDEMYQEGWAEYVYCTVKDGLSDQKAEQMFERRMKAYAEMAESLDDEVGMVMLWPVYTNEEMRGGDDMMNKSGYWNEFQSDNASTAFQSGTPMINSFVVDYYPWLYKEGADPQAINLLNYYANGANFYLPRHLLASWGESTDIFWEKSYGSEAERERWNHMTCDANSTGSGRICPSNIRRSFHLQYKYGSKSLFSNNFFM